MDYQRSRRALVPALFFVGVVSCKLGTVSVGSDPAQGGGGSVSTSVCAPHKVGETFRASDGCNTCSCDALGKIGCTLMYCAPTCSYGGKTYSEGESFPSTDGCNTCSCKAGSAQCTTTACAPTCSYGGKTYSEGDAFPATDGCNTCSCKDGSAQCTKMACAPTCTFNGAIYSEGGAFPASDGCNTCTCETGSIHCTTTTCASPCNYGSSIYHDGATFTGTDGCNACSCKAGSVQCTALACAHTCTYGGTAHNAGDTFPAADGCNTCSCEAGEVVCGSNACTGLPRLIFTDHDSPTSVLADTAPCGTPLPTATCSLRVTFGLIPLTTAQLVPGTIDLGSDGAQASFWDCDATGMSTGRTGALTGTISFTAVDATSFDFKVNAASNMSYSPMSAVGTGVAHRCVH